MPQQTPQQLQNALNPTPTNLATPSEGQVYRSSSGGLYSMQGNTLYMASIGNAGQYLSQYGIDPNQIQTIDDSKLADMNRPRPGFNVVSLNNSSGGLTDPSLLQYFKPSSATTQTQAVNTQPNQLGDIAAAQAAQQQQLAGYQGMNVTKTTTPEGVGAVQKTPLAQPGQGTQQNAQQGAIDPATGQPFTAGQMNTLDQLKMQLLGAQSALTAAGATPNELSTKYNALYDELKSKGQADSGGAARATIADTITEQDKKVTNPLGDFAQNYAQMDPISRSFFDMVNNILGSESTKLSLVDEYNKLRQTSGIEGLQTELMNMKNVIEGSEQDIRDEIEKSGGFATESNVAALTAARNKTLLKQYSQLSSQLQMKEDYINQVIALTGADRETAEKQIDRKLGLAESVTQLQVNMQNAARQNYSNLLSTLGVDGFAMAMGNNTQAMYAAEKALGLAPGALQNEALLSLMKKDESKPFQFVSGTENQRSGYFDPNTGKFTPYSGGGGGSTGSSGGGVSTNNQALNTALTTILGSGTFTKQQQTNITNAIKNGEDPFTVIKNQAKNVMGQTLATDLSKNEKARTALQDLNSAMQQYYANGGKTNIFSGSYEDALAKVGKVNDPKLRELATQIESSLQIYRNAVSGTAFSVQEGKAIAAIFPGINKTEGLNNAIVAGRMRAFDSVIDDSYAQVLGANTYAQLKQAYAQSNPPTGSIPLSSLKEVQQVTPPINWGAISFS